MRNERGITLVALVVIIVVLLISMYFKTIRIKNIKRLNISTHNKMKMLLAYSVLSFINQSLSLAILFYIKDLADKGVKLDDLPLGGWEFLWWWWRIVYIEININWRGGGRERREEEEKEEKAERFGFQL